MAVLGLHEKLAGNCRVCPTALGQAKFRLVVLTGLPPAFTALIASTKLPEGPAPVTVVGTFKEYAEPIKERRPSYPAKKKSLSFLIGPPTTAPNCFNCDGS